jgi:hypothetical protein
VAAPWKLGGALAQDLGAAASLAAPKHHGVAADLKCLSQCMVVGMAWCKMMLMMMVLVVLVV